MYIYVRIHTICTHVHRQRMYVCTYTVYVHWSTHYTLFNGKYKVLTCHSSFLQMRDMCINVVPEWSYLCLIGSLTQSRHKTVSVQRTLLTLHKIHKSTQSPTPLPIIHIIIIRLSDISYTTECITHINIYLYDIFICYIFFNKINIQFCRLKPLKF